MKKKTGYSGYKRRKIHLATSAKFTACGKPSNKNINHANERALVTCMHCLIKTERMRKDGISAFAYNGDMAFVFSKLHLLAVHLGIGILEASN